MYDKMYVSRLVISIHNGKKWTWKVAKLWDIVSGMPVEEVDLDKFNLDIDMWFREYDKPTVLNILKHCKRILNSDLNFPVIIAPNGIVLDGMHRLGKAWILGSPTVKAVHLKEWPEPDLVEDM